MSTPAPTPRQPEALYCVTGWPLAQSLSPLLHNTGFYALGIPAVYMRFAVRPEDFARFMDAVRLLPIAGASVTIPHKTTVLPYLDDMTAQARAARAVNTLYWKDGRLCGENTDVTGFLAPLAGRDLSRTRVLVLGAGGAARGAVAGLVGRGCREISIATASDKSHLPLAEEFSCTPVRWDERHDVAADLVVNATPLGMHGAHEEESPYDFSRAHLPAGATAYDIVYNPLRTRFLRKATEKGLACISGREMFFEQGAAQFRLWTGRDLPQEAREALDAAMDGDASK